MKDNRFSHGDGTASDVDEATQLLQRVRGGDLDAADQLLPAVYGQLRAIAGGYFRGQDANHTLQPTALVHEAYLKLIRAADATWNDRAHFCAVAATAMRQILRDHVDAKRAVKRGGGMAKRSALDVDEITNPSGHRAFDVIALHDALEKLSSVDERQARIVELWFFGGLPLAQIADLLEVSERTIKRDWRRTRAWLTTELSEVSP